MKKLIALLVALLWSTTAVYTVDQAEFVYVTQFGRPVATFDGASDAGLHVKLPWPMQAVQRLDRRVQMFDLPPAELLTHDPAGRTIDRTLTVEAYVAWRIAGADGVDRFLRTVGTPEQARLILGQRVGGRLGAVIGTLPMEELVSVAEPAAVAARAEPQPGRRSGDDPAESADDAALARADLRHAGEQVSDGDQDQRQPDAAHGHGPPVFAPLPVVGGTPFALGGRSKRSKSSCRLESKSTSRVSLSTR